MLVGAGCFGNDGQSGDGGEVTSVVSRQRQIVAQRSRRDPEIVVLSRATSPVYHRADSCPDPTCLEIREEHDMEGKPRSPIANSSLGIACSQTRVEEFRRAREAEHPRLAFEVGAISTCQRMPRCEIDRDIRVDEDAGHALWLAGGASAVTVAEVCDDLLCTPFVRETADELVPLDRFCSDERISAPCGRTLRRLAVLRSFRARHVHILARTLCGVRVSRRIRLCRA